jgi:photosystem II stability/assembly factor-like uncharacterized protein
MGKRAFRFCTLAALIFALAMPARAGFEQWTPYGPPEGFLVTLAIDGDHLLAATEESGVYASTDQGRTWFRSSSGLGNERIEALAVDPDDHEIYAAGQSRFFRSTDQGAHWTVLGTLPAQTQPGDDVLALAPGEPDVFFLAIGKILYRSTDGGQTWVQRLTNEPFQFEAVLVNPNDPESVFVGVPEPEGALLHSADGGTTWAPVTNVQVLPNVPTPTPFKPGVQEIVAADTDPTTLFAVAGLRLYRSTDAGASWVEIAVPAATPDYNPFIIDSVVATPGPDPRIYVFQQSSVPFQEKLYVSEDLGDTWTLMTDEARGTSLRVDPVTGDLYSFDVGGVGIAEDEGAAWRFSPLGNQTCGLSGFPRPTPKVRFAPGRTYAVVGGRLWESHNAGVSWSVLGRDLIEQCIALRDVAVDSRPRTLWAATDNSVLRSRDGGATWTRSLGPVPLGDGVPFQGVTLVDSRTILYSGFGIWRSGDHGATWKKTLPGPVLHDEFDEPGFQRSVYRIRVDPENPQIVYAGVIESGERHPLRLLPYVYQSLDGGRTWKRLSDEGYVLAIDPQHPRTLYLGTRNGLLRSRDRGRHWTTISGFSLVPGSFVPEGSDLVVDPHDSRVLYAARADDFENLGVWRSVDGGVTWERLNAGMGDLPAYEIFLDPRQAGRLYVVSQGLFVGRFSLPKD